LDERGHLYISSANRAGGEVAVTAATANTTFGDEFLVIDGDAVRDQSVASGSAAIVRVGPHQQVDVVRHGINDAGFAGDTSRFLQELTQRSETSRPS
jgi:tRNA A37 threonylcarbamoyladenosine synthetase subunit TsaC/SUA5/YrdC